MWYALPSTPTISGTWLRVTNQGVPELRVRISIHRPNTTGEEHAANEIVLIAFRQGDDYSVHACVQCSPHRGMEYLLGSDGRFRMSSCVDDQGAFITANKAHFENRRLLRMPSGLAPDAARSLWQALDAYLPQLPE